MVKVSLVDVVRLELKDENVVYTLPDKLEVKVGRDKQSNDVVLGVRENKEYVNISEKNRGTSEDFISTVSRNHCIIYNNNGIVSVIDAGSRNGTYVNDIPIYPSNKVNINDRDTLRLGFYILQVKIEED